MTEDTIKWHCRTELRKFEGDSTDEADLLEEPTVIEGNALVYGGASALWECLLGKSGAVTFGTAAIGVGDSSNTSSPTDQKTATGLNATTNTAYVACSPLPNSTSPAQHTDSTSASTAAQMQFVASFGSAQANFSWNEWGIFSSTAPGRMLNRKVESLGTKAVNSTWQLTVTLTIG